MTATSRPRTCRLWPSVWSVATIIVAAMLVVATVGCSSSSRDRGRMRVSGSVAFDGQPLGHGSVLFARIGDNDVAAAPIRSGGTFTTTLLPGEYDVVVRCFADGETTESPNNLSPPKSLIPEKYTDAKTSGLKVTASAGMAPIRLDLSR